MILANVLLSDRTDTDCTKNVCLSKSLKIAFKPEKIYCGHMPTCFYEGNALGSVFSVYWESVHYEVIVWWSLSIKQIIAVSSACPNY